MENGAEERSIVIKNNDEKYECLAVQNKILKNENCELSSRLSTVQNYPQNGEAENQRLNDKIKSLNCNVEEIETQL